MVLVRARGRLADAAGEGPRLDADIHARTRAMAPGWDPHWLEAEWRRWWRSTGGPVVRSPDAAFLAFAKARAERGPRD